VAGQSAALPDLRVNRLQASREAVLAAFLPPAGVAAEPLVIKPGLTLPAAAVICAPCPAMPKATGWRSGPQRRSRSALCWEPLPW